MSERKENIPPKSPGSGAPSIPEVTGNHVALSVSRPDATHTAEKTPTEAGPEKGEPVQTTASVKFMITMQDEQKLRELGYTQDQIYKLKPEEAAEILRCGTPPDPDSQA